ncbi:MAG: hypothetical protein CL840_13820 [Crocinitomicaceae bacterium]|nr:hypothetical protein [Crocinitomicaceae bacterium]
MQSKLTYISFSPNIFGPLRNSKKEHGTIQFVSIFLLLKNFEFSQPVGCCDIQIFSDVEYFYKLNCAKAPYVFFVWWKN